MKTLMFRVLPLALLLVFAGSVLVSAQQTGTSSIEEITLSLEDLQVPQLALMGNDADAGVWFPFRSDWFVAGDVRINVDYTASPLLNPEMATLTVVFDGAPLYSLRPIPDGQTHSFSFLIPRQTAFGRDGLWVEFHAANRVGGDICTPEDPAAWVTIEGTSVLNVAVAPNTTVPELQQLPDALFVDPVAGYVATPPVVLVLPDEPDTFALDAAASIANRLGILMDGTLPNLQVIRANELTRDQQLNAHMIVVGTPENQPVLAEIGASLPAILDEGGFRTADNLLAPPEHGVVQVANSPWNAARRILVVSGGDNTGLERAARAFTHEVTFEGLEGQFQFIQDEEPTNPAILPWNGRITSLEDLGERSIERRGEGLAFLNFDVPRPPGLSFGEDSKLVLDVAYSQTLAPTTEFAVYLEGVLIGNGRIGRDEPQRNTWIFDLPVDEINAIDDDNMRLQAQATLSLGGDPCSNREANSAWFRVENTSFFRSDQITVDPPTLQDYPYPFVHYDGESTTVVVVPPEPTNGDLGNALALIASLSGSVPNYPQNLKLITADDFDIIEDGRNDVIVLGSLLRQPLYEAFGLEAESVVTLATYQNLALDGLGVVEHRISPWSGTKHALLVYGTTPAGFDNALVALMNPDANLTNAPNNVVLIEAGSMDTAELTTLEAELVVNEDLNQQNLTIYTVQAGDTLTAIATANDTTVDEIIALNSAVTNPTQISIGQQIFIPGEPESEE